MKRPEQLTADSRQLSDLRKLVAQGEGLRLEFKRKASFPDKIARELVAFANTAGGTLLVGVDDDGSIPGVKYPEEELLVIEKELEATCRPALPLATRIMRVSEKRFVLWIDVDHSPKRPHYLVVKGKKVSFVREKDESLSASREMQEVIRRLRTSKGVRFPYGDAEQKVIHFLADHPGITVGEFARLTGMNRFAASRKLVRLVVANVLRITPAGKGDIYSRA